MKVLVPAEIVEEFLWRQAVLKWSTGRAVGAGHGELWSVKFWKGLFPPELFGFGDLSPKELPPSVARVPI